MKVVLAGLVYLPNFGEKFIADNVNYLVKDIDESIETVFLDFEKLRSSFSDKIKIKLVTLGVKLNNYRFVYRIMRSRFIKQFESVIKDADAVIFACGSFKYGTQYLWAFYSILIEAAEKHGVPVMFDAMNVQDYNSSDARCEILKEHLNYPCVKMFTTRDGMHGLNKVNSNYKTNPSLNTALAGDPAYWIRECYGIEKQSSNTIGVNLIRGRIFADYSGGIDEEKLLEIYADFINRLEKNGEKWELFTNGLDADLQFGEKLLNRLGIQKEIKVPSCAEELVKLISSYKCIMGARLHACICAYSLDVPVASFYWDEKMIRFAELAKIQDFFLDSENLTGEALFEKIIKCQDSQYDSKNREFWKNETRKTIKQFLSEFAKGK